MISLLLPPPPGFTVIYVRNKNSEGKNITFPWHRNNIPKNVTGFHVCSQNTSEPENLTAANSYSIELQLLSYHCMKFSQKLMCPVYQQLQRMVCLNILIEKPDFWYDTYVLFSETSRGLHSFSKSEGARRPSSLIQTSRWFRTGPHRGLSAPHWSTHKIPTLASLQPVLYQLTGREGTHRRAH